MGKNRRTTAQAMKLWWVCYRGRRLKIRARTARVAARKYLRGNVATDIVRDSLEMFYPSITPFGDDHIKGAYRRHRGDAKAVTIADINVTRA